MKNTKRLRVNVVEDDKQPIEKNVLASAIVEMSAAAKKLSKGGLTHEAIVVLTQHNCKAPHKYGTKPGLAEVRAVMASLDELASRFARVF